MSRSRNIKPGFFKNDLLVELPFEHRLLFIGLWTEADRDGRLEDRPIKIKMALFPADNVDVNAGLQALHDKGFILRYSVGENQYIQVLAWSKHQNPHCKEARSIIPAPGEHGASTVQAPEVPERAGLIPDSGFLIPDSSKEQAPRARASEAVPRGTDAGTACRLMREAGCATTNPSHPQLLAALAEGVTPEALRDTAAEAVAAGKSNPFPWAIATARNRRAEGVPAVNGASHAPARKLSAVEQVRAANERRRRQPADALEGTATRVG